MFIATYVCASLGSRVTKTQLGHMDDSCANLLKVLADETRLAVVRELMAGAKHVNEINCAVPVEQSLLSHHLQVLRKAGIVEAERDGKAQLYRIAPGLTGRRIGDTIDLGCCRISFD